MSEKLEADKTTANADSGSGTSKVKLKKSLNVLGAMSIIVGSIIGSGIFISPKGILLYTGSIGESNIIARYAV